MRNEISTILAASGEIENAAHYACEERDPNKVHFLMQQAEKLRRMAFMIERRYPENNS